MHFTCAKSLPKLSVVAKTQKVFILQTNKLCAVVARSLECYECYEQYSVLAVNTANQAIKTYSC